MRTVLYILFLIGTGLILSSCGKGLQMPFIPVPPQSATQSATGMEASRATLQGRVNPAGMDAAAWFEWGPTPDYGNVTSPQSIGNGTADLPITQPVIDLIPATTYHYRVVAESSAGSTAGSDIAFTTSGIVAPAVTTGSVSVITKTGATLQGTVNPNSFVANGWFEWGTTTDYGNSSLRQSLGSGSDPVVISQAISGLTADTLYHYRVVGENGGGGTFGPDQTFTTLAVTLSTPTAVSTAASDLTHTTVTLNGTINPNGLSSVAWFEWGTGVSYGNTTPAQSVGAGTTDASVSQSISGLQSGIEYHYRIVGQNSDGSATGNDQVFTATPYQTQAYLLDPAGAVNILDPATNTVVKTITMTNPVAAAVTPDGTKVYVVNGSSATVSVLETVGNTIIATIPVSDAKGGLPQSIGILPNGTTVYVGSDILWSIDVATDTVKMSMPLPDMISVEGFAFKPDSSRLFVFGYFSLGTNAHILDPSNNQIKKTLSGGSNGRWTMSPDGQRLYRTGLSSNKGFNAYSVVTDGGSLVGSLPDLEGLRVAVSPDGAKVYASTYFSDPSTGKLIQKLVIVDAATMQLSPQSFTGVSGWAGMSFSGGNVYAASATSGAITGTNNIITIIDMASDVVKGTLTAFGPVGTIYPYRSGMVPFGSLVYFIDSGGGSVGMIDVPTNTLKPSLSIPASALAFSFR